MDKVTYDGIVFFVKNCASLMKENKEYLTLLDASMGDGDLGLTMVAGFDAAETCLVNYHEADLGKVLMKIGMTFAQVVPSTMGTLIASGFMSAGKNAKGKTEFTTISLAGFFSDFARGIMERGKAKAGERTIVDSILPAAVALKESAIAGKALVVCCEDGFKAAEKGVEATKKMMPVFGRAVYYGGKLLGCPDQGAIVGMFIYKALLQTVTA